MLLYCRKYWLEYYSWCWTRAVVHSRKTRAGGLLAGLLACLLERGVTAGVPLEQSINAR